MLAFLLCVISMEVQGHRGCRGHYPENTLPAFEVEADVLEMDLLLTSDGEIVVHHDFDIDETLVCSMTLAEIKKVDVGAQNPLFPDQKTIPGTQIPTLQEVFDLVRDRTVRLNLELKREPYLTSSSELIAKTVVGAVHRNHFQSRVYYSSFDPEVLAEVNKIDPQASLGFCYYNETLEVAKEVLAGSLHFDVISPDHELLKSAEEVQALKCRGARVIPWTVNEMGRVRELIQLGVDGVITDYPEEVIQSCWQINTSNQGKLSEFERLFAQYGEGLRSTHIDLEEIQADPVSVVVDKARKVPEGVLVEDTSLDVEGSDVGINVRFLLDHLPEGRKALWRVLLAYAKEGKVYVYEGSVSGTIVKPRGGDGFGFDPVFLPDGAEETLAQAKPDRLNARAKAVASLLRGSPLEVKTY